MTHIVSKQCSLLSSEVRFRLVFADGDGGRVVA